MKGAESCLVALEPLEQTLSSSCSNTPECSLCHLLLKKKISLIEVKSVCQVLPASRVRSLVSVVWLWAWTL